MSVAKPVSPIELNKVFLDSGSLASYLTYDVRGLDSVVIQTGGPESWPSSCVLSVKVGDDLSVFGNPVVGATAISSLGYQASVSTVGCNFLRLQVSVIAASGNISIYPRLIGVTVS